MRLAFWISLATLLSSSGCGTHRDFADSSALTSAQKHSIEDGVRRFALDVSRDVSREGPTAWRKHFADSPSFFMVVNGHLVFPNSESATEGIQSFAHTIQHIELHWGDDIRVDPLTPGFAIVATPWTEVQTDLRGHQVTTSGFFTALAEGRNGQWQFRNAHWSEPVPPSKVP